MNQGVWYVDENEATKELYKRIEEVRISGGDLDISDLFSLRGFPKGALVGLHVKALKISAQISRVQLPDGKFINPSTRRTFNFSGIKELKHLESIRVKYIDGVNFQEIYSIPTVRSVYVSFSQFDPSIGASKAQELRQFHASYCRVTSLRELRGMKYLNSISAVNSQFSDLNELGELPLLNHLDIGKSRLKDISPIINFPIFADEKAEFLSYVDTPASKKDNRLNMLSNIDPTQSAIQTAQYLKGNHPDFQKPSFGTINGGIDERLRKISPVRLVDKGGVITAENQNPVENEDEIERAERIYQLKWLCDSFLDEAKHVQCPQHLVRRTERLLDHISGESPVYYIVESSIKVIEVSIEDPYILSGIDSGIVEILREIVRTKDWLNPLMSPPRRIVDAALDSLPNIKEGIDNSLLERAVDEVEEVISRDDTVEEFNNNVREVARELKEEVSALDRDNYKERKSVTARVAGFVSFLSSVVTVHTWVTSSAGASVIATLNRVMQILISLFK